MTLMLTRADMRALLDEQALLDALRQAFVAYSTRRSVEAMRIPVPLPVSDVPAGASGMLLAPGLVPGIPAYSVKVHAKFPGRDPAIRGVLLLNDLQTGDLLAMMESSYLTALRTGLAGALGADALARPEARTVAIIGAGAQGRAQLAALRLLRRIDRVQVFDPVPQAVADYLAQPCCAGIAAVGCGSLEEAMQAADIVITATWAREPFLYRRHVRPGMHITTLGPDQPGKCEVAAEVLERARVVVDDRRLALEMGAVGGAGLGAEVIHAELGEVLAGTRAGRTDPDAITVFGSVGLAFQDLAAGWLAYRRAVAAGLGRRIDLLD
ncbi:ornithine cyclodeaminase family protein [Rhizobium sp. CSW-27]|uniref:ornithine cyclodeaminase family protein n=1 Tax=Rhizobium sp. CSW-27 TaxID=2839985 RepID=UPI001C028953|nr:ornithine cyclodeaminase family protein [Rhizobium sp. CSW-27]MBT9368667.1 ornithine cyclodeaminase family protein [Rhizobium sp. CSW-27]